MGGRSGHFGNRGRPVGGSGANVMPLGASARVFGQASHTPTPDPPESTVVNGNSSGTTPSNGHANGSGLQPTPNVDPIPTQATAAKESKKKQKKAKNTKSATVLAPATSTITTTTDATATEKSHKQNRKARALGETAPPTTNAHLMSEHPTDVSVESKADKKLKKKLSKLALTEPPALDDTATSDLQSKTKKRKLKHRDGEGEEGADEKRVKKKSKKDRKWETDGDVEMANGVVDVPPPPIAADPSVEGGEKKKKKKKKGLDNSAITELALVV